MDTYQVVLFPRAVADAFEVLWNAIVAKRKDLFMPYKPIIISKFISYYEDDLGLKRSPTEMRTVALKFVENMPDLIASVEVPCVIISRKTSPRLFFELYEDDTDEDRFIFALTVNHKHIILAISFTKSSKLYTELLYYFNKLNQNKNLAIVDEYLYNNNIATYLDIPKHLDVKFGAPVAQYLYNVAVSITMANAVKQAYIEKTKDIMKALREDKKVSITNVTSLPLFGHIYTSIFSGRDAIKGVVNENEVVIQLLRNFMRIYTASTGDSYSPLLPNPHVIKSDSPIGEPIYGSTEEEIHKRVKSISYAIYTNLRDSQIVGFTISTKGILLDGVNEATGDGFTFVEEYLNELNNSSNVSDFRRVYYHLEDTNQGLKYLAQPRLGMEKDHAKFLLKEAMRLFGSSKQASMLLKALEDEIAELEKNGSAAQDYYIEYSLSLFENMYFSDELYNYDPSDEDERIVLREFAKVWTSYVQTLDVDMEDEKGKTYNIRKSKINATASLFSLLPSMTTFYKTNMDIPVDVSVPQAVPIQRTLRSVELEKFFKTVFDVTRVYKQIKG